MLGSKNGGICTFCDPGKKGNDEIANHRCGWIPDSPQKAKVWSRPKSLLLLYEFSSDRFRCGHNGTRYRSTINTRGYNSEIAIFSELCFHRSPFKSQFSSSINTSNSMLSTLSISFVSANSLSTGTVIATYASLFTRTP